jgi:hypothetical protein
MHRSILRAGIGLFSASLLTTTAVYAQTSFATIHGTVTDATGAAVPGASVAIKNESTGVVTTAKSNGTGFYNAPLLQIGGPYTVTVTATGFQQYTSSGLTLNVNDNHETDAKLAVGSQSQSVQVSANNAQVETTDTQLKNIIDARAIEQIPLINGNAAALQKLQAGSVEASDRFGTYSANGSQSQSNSFILDGIDINDGPLQNQGFTVTQDALAQEAIITSTLNPEYSRNSGAIVNQVLKSGTNQFHGDLFEFYRDTFLNNGNYFSQTRPPFHQNRYGATLGGPLVKNKLFFFVAYQGLRNRTGSTNQTPVPTAIQRGGNFGALLGSNSDAVTPFQVGNCPKGALWSSCFGNGQAVPASAFNPIAVKLLNQFVPQANSVVAGQSYYNFNTADTEASDQGVVRLDYHLSQNDAIYGTSVFASTPTSDTLPFDGGDLPGFGQNNAEHFKLFSADYTHTFSSNLLNDFGINYFRFNYAAVEPQTVVQPASYGFNITPQSPSAGLPYIGIKGLFDLGFSADGPQPRKDTNLRANDAVTYVRGNHTMKFGASVEQFRVSNPFYGPNNGAYSFNGSGAYSSGNPLADFLLGIPDQYSQGSGSLIDALAYEDYFYAQDSWKATSDLTLNFGAAYDIETPNKTRQYNGLGVSCFSISSATTSVFQGADAPPGLAFPGDPGCNSYGGATIKYDHVGPRFGFAWSPSSGSAMLLGRPGMHDLSIRGGFGVYYNRDSEEGQLQNISTPPFGLTSQGVASGGPGLNPGFANPFSDVAGKGSIVNPFPFAQVGKGSVINWDNYYPLDMNVTSPKYATPYVYNFNLNVQRELPGNMVLQMAYVGSLGRKLVIVTEADPITSAGHAACVADTNGCAQDISTHVDYPQYTAQPATASDGSAYYASVGQQSTIGASNYNSAQVTLTKQETHGFQFTAAYTYSKALDNGSGLESSGFNGRSYNQYPGYASLNYGPSDYDARQRLALSFVYSVPVFHTGNALLREALSGWQLADISAFQTGFPLNITDTGVFLSKWCDQYSYYGCPDTPNVSTFDVHSRNIRSTGTWFDPALFSQEATGTFGNVARGLVHGPGFNYSNVDVAKNFPLGADGVRSIQLRMDASNVFNHANFAAPDSNYGDPEFGAVTSVIDSAGEGADPQGGRAIQLVGRVTF